MRSAVLKIIRRISMFFCTEFNCSERGGFGRYAAPEKMRSIFKAGFEQLQQNITGGQEQILTRK